MRPQKGHYFVFLPHTQRPRASSPFFSFSRADFRVMQISPQNSRLQLLEIDDSMVSVRHGTMLSISPSTVIDDDDPFVAILSV